MAPDSLLWEPPDPEDIPDEQGTFAELIPKLDLTPRYGRREIFEQAHRNRELFWHWLSQDDPTIEDTRRWERLLGVHLLPDAPKTIARTNCKPRVSVQSLRTARRTGPDGQSVRQMIAEVSQRRRAFLDPVRQATADAGESDPEGHDFYFYGGVTLIVDLDTGRIAHAVRKRIDDEGTGRLDAERAFRNGERPRALAATYFGQQLRREPFAFLHRT